MYYKKEVNDFEKALGLPKARVDEIKKLVAEAYNLNWHYLGPNIDQMNAFLAPFIETQEEAFYVATIVITDVLGAIKKAKL